MIKASREVLVLDDDAEVRRLIRSIFDSVGFKVHEVENVDDAVRVSLDLLPHLIIIDLNLSIESGYSFFSKRQESSVLNQIPVMVISCLNSDNAVRRALAAGADDYVMKPFNTLVVLQKARRLLRERQIHPVQFSESCRPKLEGILRGNITRASEVGFIVELSTKLAPGSRLRIESQLLRDLGLTQCIFQSALRPAPLGPVGLYLNRIVSIGLKESTAQQVRRNVIRWK